MGKRVAVSTNADQQQQQNVTPLHITRNIRKRKRATNVAAAPSAGKSQRLNNTNSYNDWHENDDEDSSSNDGPTLQPSAVNAPRNQSTKHANNSSIILLNSSLNASIGGADTSATIESPKPVYTLRPSVVNGTILHDITAKPWRLGRPIGKGNFGEIFLASDNTSIPVTNENANFVVKIEPHSNGPLFVEIHCLMNTAKSNPDNVEENVGGDKQLTTTRLSNIPPSGIPDYIASGSHFFGDARYRFLVLQRFDRDLHSLIKNCRVHQKSVLTLAIHIINVLENLHDKGYCHNDVKAQNLMISKCKYLKEHVMKVTKAANGQLDQKQAPNVLKTKYDDQHYEEKQQTTDSGNSSEQEANEDGVEDDDEEFIIKRKIYKIGDDEDDDEDEDFDDGATSNSNNSNSMDIYRTPLLKNRNRRVRKSVVEFSGSNPVRSCRRDKPNAIYDEMVKSHYLRPAKRISYSQFFNEDGGSINGDTQGAHSTTSADESEEFIPGNLRQILTCTSARRHVRQQQDKQPCSNITGKVMKGAKRNRSIILQAEDKMLTSKKEFISVEEERIFLIDFGLASKFMDNGVHRPFIMDQRRAHDGTLEFTSRDAHLGAHSRRSDLECLGYNLLYWSQGYLPWKDAATQQQQEKVHRSKELLMTDVREMLKQIYGKQVPKYLGEFLHHVNQLAYQERPNYACYRKIFNHEYQQLGYDHGEMQLSSVEIERTCIRVKDELENNYDIFDLNNKQNVTTARNSLLTTPFHDRTLSNRVSPKNLRSKSDKKNMKKKKFSWAEVLSQDPDQIARARAEKEFVREEGSYKLKMRTARRFEGKPTYAILEIQQRLKPSDRLHKGEQESETDENDEEEDEDDENEKLDDEENSENDDAENYTELKQENEDAEEDMDSDTTETSAYNNRRTRYKTTKKKFVFATLTPAMTTITSSTPTTVRQKGKGATAVKFSTKTRSTANLKSTLSPVQQQANSKRGSATRYDATGIIGRRETAGAASAAGEITEQRQQFLNENTGSSVNKPRERRTRRCLIKTDIAVKVKNELDDEMNSNFGTDMRTLYKVRQQREHIMHRTHYGSHAANYC